MARLPTDAKAERLLRLVSSCPVSASGRKGRTARKGSNLSGGRLTTHVLDTSAGRPAQGIAISLYRIEGCERRHIADAVTNADGRTDGPIMPPEAFAAGRYELVFKVEAYLRQSGHSLPEPPFLEEIPIRFGIADAGGHYHVPLLLSPYGYSTYRGS